MKEKKHIQHKNKSDKMKYCDVSRIPYTDYYKRKPRCYSIYNNLASKLKEKNSRSSKSDIPEAPAAIPRKPPKSAIKSNMVYKYLSVTTVYSSSGYCIMISMKPSERCVTPSVDILVLFLLHGSWQW